jgi:hypothetical protein
MTLGIIDRGAVVPLPFGKSVKSPTNTCHFRDSSFNGAPAASIAERGMG